MDPGPARRPLLMTFRRSESRGGSRWLRIASAASASGERASHQAAATSPVSAKSSLHRKHRSSGVLALSVPARLSPPCSSTWPATQQDGTFAHATTPALQVAPMSAWIVSAARSTGTVPIRSSIVMLRLPRRTADRVCPGIAVRKRRVPIGSPAGRALPGGCQAELFQSMLFYLAVSAT